MLLDFSKSIRTLVLTNICSNESVVGVLEEVMSVGINAQSAVIAFPMTRKMERRVFRSQYGITGLRGLRLTRRGKVTLILLAFLMSVGLFLIGSSSMARQPLSAVPVETYPVAQGDSLWSIAESMSVGGDIRDVVADIVELNKLPSAAIEAGSIILLPVYED